MRERARKREKERKSERAEKLIHCRDREREEREGEWVSERQRKS